MNTIGYKTQAQQAAEAVQTEQLTTSAAVNEPQETNISNAHLNLRLNILALEDIILANSFQTQVPQQREIVLMQYRTLLELNNELNIKNTLLDL